ncbi:hypothetical protein [Variovorax paradoxus]|uniref:hypothetical protein n=1 Tax=Variovorax paradoxus TaxID=34073 RepID=UPI00278BA237|nr:hypothetical protein [Variovorax paradoxus]MDP9932632.1 hypothetical protein [Variovorax paradoxus]
MQQWAKNYYSDGANSLNAAERADGFADSTNRFMPPASTQTLGDLYAANARMVGAATSKEGWVAAARVVFSNPTDGERRSALATVGSAAMIGLDVAPVGIVGKEVSMAMVGGVRSAWNGAKAELRLAAAAQDAVEMRVAGDIGVPATRSANPLSTVLEFDAHGNEIMYRSMSREDYRYLRDFGELRPTTETSISPNLAYSSKYTNNNSVTVRFATTPGTSAALQEIGIAANPPAAKALSLAERNDSWMQTNTRFKVEGGQMTTQLGQGPGITTFNRGIVDFELVR